MLCWLWSLICKGVSVYKPRVGFIVIYEIEKSLSVFSNFINFLQISVTKKHFFLIRNQLAFIIDLL